MRNVFVIFDVNVAQSSEHPLVKVTPDLRFSGAFDRDDKKSFGEMCDLEFHVKELAQALKFLGCQVSVVRREEVQLVF